VTTQDKTIALAQNVDTEVQKLNTSSLDISFNELLEMREAKELDITPDFQRLFRWSNGQQSRFIESLLLEMPVPPIFVIEQEDGRYILIDGLQRISSYLHLRGKLEAAHLDPPIKYGQMLKLTECDIIPSLNELTYDDLGTALQIRLKRAFVRVEVVKRTSDPKFKYHMFKRLNTGGENLTEQQIRNCTIRLLDVQFNDFIKEMSQSEAFVEVTDILTDTAKLGAFDEELVLRFFALKNNLDGFKHDVSDFLTDYMENVTVGKQPFDYGAERVTFERTFEFFRRTLGDRAFGNPNRKGPGITRGFSTYHFEALTIGIQKILGRIDLDNKDLLNALKQKLEEIKRSDDFMRLTTGGGKNSPGPLKKRISYVNDQLGIPA
jgi:hypothetical protein